MDNTKQLKKIKLFSGMPVVWLVKEKVKFLNFTNF